MRDYSKVSGSFWTGKTGKSLRGDFQSQIVAMYLMTSPHANMIGVFHCPVIYIAHETGSPLEGALKGLEKLCEGGFCTYDKDSETVWVHEMAKFQIGDELKPNDNRVKDIQKQYANLPEGRIKTEFFAKYSTAFHLQNNKPLASPLQAPPKPEAGTEAEAEVNTLSGKPDESAPENSKPKRRKSHRAESSEILAYMNEKVGSNFRAVESNTKLIEARIDEGATVEELKRVIDTKTAEWKKDPKMREYLRPSTLFNPTKYAQYAGQLTITGSSSKPFNLDDFYKQVGA